MPPIPNDLPLSIPGSVPFFTVLLVISFVLHILFVLLTVSGAVMSVVTEAVGVWKRDQRYIRLAEQVLTATSVNKSLAVVLGVAPLLLVSVLYTRFYYPPTVILGGAWLSVIWLLIVGFLLLYAYKFSWNALQNKPVLHLLLGALGALVFLVVPMIFVATLGLMRRPDLWTQTNSFLQAISYPTVWPRYLHFIAATLAFGGLLPVGIAWRMERKRSSIPASEVAATGEDEPLNPKWAASYGIRWTAVTLLIQIPLGLLVLFAVPDAVRGHFLGGSVFSTSLLAVAVASVLAALGAALYHRNGKNPAAILRNLGVLLAIVLLVMGLMRLQVRDYQIEPYASTPSHSSGAAAP
ncbi:MAG: cytochrome ubiquinol oxidase subunit I [Alicyclobacillaceae bacterium]|nr:cytochrome ubiquinol oxidase subunit I [Alicyclobacillaceae bacterium]